MPYHLAQRALADLKYSIYQLLLETDGPGLRNADIGRALGIYKGHIKHEGHIPRTLLDMMEAEGVVEQNETTKLWSLKPIPKQ